MVKFRYVLMLLFAVFMLGSILRVYQLSEESLWVDEGFTYDYINLPNDKLILTLEKQDIHSPLFYYITRISTNLFGQSELGLRFPSFIFGSLAILLIFLISLKLFNLKTALTASFISATSYTLILFSQEAKNYSLFILFYLLVLLFFIYCLNSKKIVNYILLGIFNALMVYSHVIGILIIIIELILFNIFYLLKKNNFDILKQIFKKIEFKSKLNYFYYSFLITAILYLPWIKILLAQFKFIFFYFLPWKFSQKFGFNNFYIFLIITIILSVVLLFLIFKNFTKPSFLRKVISLVKKIDFLVFPVIIIFIIINLIFHKNFLHPIPYVRYTLFLLPLFHIFIAYKISGLNKKLFLLFIFFIALVSSIILYDYYTIDGKEQWREAAKFVEETQQGSELIVFDSGIYTRKTFDYYYAGNLSQISIHNISQYPLIKAEIENHDFAYLIVSHNYGTKDFYRDYMDKNYAQIAQKPLIDIKIYKYRIKPIN